jgi:hypothetical protein
MEHQVMVFLDLRPIQQNGVERGFRTFLSTEVGFIVTVIFYYGVWVLREMSGNVQGEGTSPSTHGIRQVPFTDTLQESTQTIIVPVTLAITPCFRFILEGFQISEPGSGLGNHFVRNHVPLRARDPTKHIGQFQCGQEQTSTLFLELLGSLCDIFLA